MSIPHNVLSYEPEWALLATHLTKTSSLTLPVGDVKGAKALRLRFYGFRKALERHDATNPWIPALMETQATITPQGDLHFERSPYAVVLRGLLEYATIPRTHESELDKTSSPTTEDVVVSPDGTKHDETILSFITKGKP